MESLCSCIVNDLVLGRYTLARIEYQMNRWSKKIQASDLDDMRQEIFVSLLLVAGHYRPSHASVKTFASKQIVRSVCQFLACLRRNLNRDLVSMEWLQEDEQPLFNETHRGERSELDRIYMKIDLDAAIKEHLTERQQFICRMLLAGLSPLLTACRLRISPAQFTRDMGEIRDIFNKIRIS